MMRKIGLAGAAAIMLAAAGSAPAQAGGPDVCGQFLEPQMQQHQYFDDDTQAVIDSLSPCKD
jgi:TRAP-type C4-dicarboxylate transport system permease large subunit